MFITWPDNWYHASQDTPDKQDSTQYKRAAVVATGAMAVLATGGDEMAARVVSENLSRGAERMGESYRKALSYIADAANAPSLASAYKEAIVTIRHQANVEKGVVRSAKALFDNPVAGEKKVQVFEPLIDKRAAALLTRDTRLVLLVPSIQDADTVRVPLRKLGYDFNVIAARDFGAGDLAMSVVIADLR